MARTQLYFCVFFVISCIYSEEIQNHCPKLCQCENSVETGFRMKCENVKDIKEILFGENSSEIVHL